MAEEPEPDKPAKKVGVYDRPASADRRATPWIWIIAAALILVALFIAHRFLHLF